MPLPCRLTLILSLLTVSCAVAEKPPVKPTDLPTLPDELRKLVPSKRDHPGTPAVRLFRKDGHLGIGLSTQEPLTQSQWDAVEELHPRLFAFNDRSLTDDGMDRLVGLDPLSVALRITPLSGTGAAKFGRMKNLKSLTSHHLHQPTPEAREALANHPSLQDFRTAGEFCIEALSAPLLKSVELAEKAATAARVEELAKQTGLETLSLFAHNITTVDDSCMKHVAKIRSLQTLKIAFAALTYEGGLKPLEGMPNLRILQLHQVDISPDELQRFQTARPEVKITHTTMTAEYRTKWKQMIQGGK